MSLDELTTPTHPRETPGDPPRSSVPAQLRPLLRRLHFYAGVAVAPFLLVAALTGLAYTTTPAIEHVVYAHELRVDVGEQRLALADQVAAARAAHPEGVVSEVRVSDAADATTRVVLAVDGLPTDRQRTVFVDPWTGEVRGDLLTFGEWLPVRSWVDELHRTLHLGEVGRVYSELAASWLWVVVGGGLALWTGKKVSAARGRGWATALRAVVTPGASPRAGTRSRTLAWHGAAGVWLGLGLLALSATGLTWSHFAGTTIGQLRTALSWQTPVLDTDLGDGTVRVPGAPAGSEHAAHTHHPAGGATTGGDALVDDGAGIDAVAAAARAQGLVTPYAITPPPDGGSAWTVAETRRVWPVRQDSVAVDGADAAVDGADAAVVDVARFDDYPIGAKLTRWGVDGHMGLLLGPANLVLLAALAAGLVVMIVGGYRMWWLRRPPRAVRLRPGAAPRRGAWRAMSAPTAVVVAVVTLAVALALPVLGVSLALFLLVDLALSRAGARRAAAPGPRAPATPAGGR